MNQITLPIVSIVVPTHNRASLLKETVEAILAQSFKNFELLIVNNLSTDSTEEYARNLQDPRVRYFQNDKNNNVASTRNVGIANACGRYVAFCDDDDIWLPQKLEKQLEVFSEEGISCVASNFIPIGDARFFKKYLSSKFGESFRDFTYKEILLYSNPVINSSVIARRDWVLNLGGFDEAPHFLFIEDWELWLRLSRKGKIRILTEPLVKYRTSIKKGRDERQITLNTLKILEKQKSLGSIEASIFRQAQGNCFVSIGKAFLDKNDRKGIIFFWRGLIQSRDGYQKLKALAGILLFYLPQSLRNQFLASVHRLTCPFS